MTNDTGPEVQAEEESNESFGELLSQYERSHTHSTPEGPRQLRGTVVAVTDESVFLDIGYKTEGVLPRNTFASEAALPKPGDTLLVSIKGRNEEGYYVLSRLLVEQPKDWDSLEQAFENKAILTGAVTGLVKGGFTVDIGVRAFLPASRSGVREAAEMAKLVGQEIHCRITKIDVADEDVVVDRRSVLEEEAHSAKERRYTEIHEGDILSGTVRSLTGYGAFIDLGGIDGLLHISDMAWSRVSKPEDVLSVGQPVDVKVLKIDSAGQRISLGMKQLQPHPWDAVPERYMQGQRVTGVVTRTADFGAFVELEPGVEGMIHLSEMSWAKKVRKAEDMVKPGDTVDTVILNINIPEHRIALGLKQALGDPWVEAAERYPVGSIVEGPVVSFTKFGASVQVTEGVEGMVHISEITAERRLNHPQDVLRSGQRVQAKVLELDRDKRQMRLSIKQTAPTGVEEFFADHKEGDTVTGRLVEIAGNKGTVELGEDVLATCSIPAESPLEETAAPTLDLSALTSMLNAKWKSGSTPAAAKERTVQAGQVRSFRIVRLDPESRAIHVELI